MLTKTDLKEIRKVFREEIETELENKNTEIQSDITALKMRLAMDMSEIKDRQKNIEIKINKVIKNLKTVGNFLDKEHLKLSKRVKEIESHVNFPIP